MQTIAHMHPQDPIASILSYGSECRILLMHFDMLHTVFHDTVCGNHVLQSTHVKCLPTSTCIHAYMARSINLRKQLIKLVLPIVVVQSHYSRSAVTQKSRNSGTIQLHAVDTP